MADWDRIVREQGPLVYRTAWRILGHAADTEDVVQEVFLQAHQFVKTRAVRHWSGLLRRLAACRALDRLRQRRCTLSLDGLDLPTNGETPDEAAVSRELAERLRQAIAELPPREAEVFCLLASAGFVEPTRFFASLFWGGWIARRAPDQTL